VGRGPNGGTDDDAIAQEPGDHLPVHGQLHVEHLERRAGPDDHLVEAQDLARPGPVGQAAHEHAVLGDAIFAPDDFGQVSDRLVGGKIGQEAEAAQVHAQDGHLVVTHLAGGPQDRSVATQDER
jgi:hypothetical protein